MLIPGLAVTESCYHSETMNKKHTSFQNDTGTGPTRLCDWPGCKQAGEFRAPKSREELDTYLWFCLEHIREYNKSWNYYEGMNDMEVEEDLRRDTVWDRPTWRLGSNAGAFGSGSEADPFNLFSDGGRTSSNGGVPGVRPPLNKEEENAYRVLGLEYPVSSEDIKIRYKALVKEHHPDANKGAPGAEEKLKEINQAYHTLRDALSV